MKLQSLLIGAAIAVCTAAPLAAQTLTTWDSPVNVTASGGALSKSGGCNGCGDSGAHSLAQLTGDGYADFVPAAGQQLYAGLSSDLTASTSSATINYAFNIWPDGTWDIRELGVYKTEGAFAAGDHFRVAVESGKVVYRHNGTAVYTSAVAPVYPVALDVTLYSAGASLSQATIAAGSTTTTGGTTTGGTTGGTTTGGTTTGGTTSTSGTPTRTAIGPYLAVTDRNTYTKPALPTPGPAGSVFTDPTFQSSIRRMTDGNTRPGYLSRSYRTPSSTHVNEWSAANSYFYVVSDDGSAIPF